VQWTAIVRLLGEPAASGHHPAVSEQWQLASEIRAGTAYAVWDCNNCLTAVKEAGRVLDRLEAEYDFEDMAMLRGFIAQFFAVSCCLANCRDETNVDSWKIINGCVRHRIDINEAC
jgi:hypothetical protein